MIAKSPLPPGQRGSAKGFVATLLAHPELASGHWPAELFHPMTGTRRDMRDYTLADGSPGTTTVDVDARGDGPGGLLQRYHRTIVTEAGGSLQRSEEIWTLTAAGDGGLTVLFYLHQIARFGLTSEGISTKARPPPLAGRLCLGWFQMRGSIL